MCSSCFILNSNILIYILLVFIRFFTNSPGFLFRLVENNKCLITLITQFMHIFQYVAIFNKMTFSNINSLSKVLLIVVLVFLWMKIRKALHCNIVSSEDFLKLHYLKSYSCHLIRKFLNFSQFYLFLVNFSVFIRNACSLFYITLHYLYLLLIQFYHLYNYHHIFCQSNLFWDCVNDF